MAIIIWSFRRVMLRLVPLFHWKNCSCCCKETWWAIGYRRHHCGPTNASWSSDSYSMYISLPQWCHSLEDAGFSYLNIYHSQLPFFLFLFVISISDDAFWFLNEFLRYPFICFEGPSWHFSKNFGSWGNWVSFYDFIYCITIEYS